MATTQQVKIQPRPTTKQINYLSKTFSDFRQNFIEFAKAYYPNSYADFNEASPGMMFIEMASYLGDVLSFYIDNSFKENLLQYAEEPENIITIAQFLGYKPRLISPATTEVTLTTIVPATLVGQTWVPDSRFLLKLKAGTIFSTNEAVSIPFRLEEDVNFSAITEEDYYAIDYVDNRPSSFLVTATGRVVSAVEKEVSVNIGSAQKFSKVLLPDEAIIGITSVVDSYGNDWYEVDYLAQDIIMDELEIVSNNQEGLMPPSGLRFKKIARRFVTRTNRDLRTELVFGSGESTDSDVDMLVDSRQVANAQYGTTIKQNVSNLAINNFNFLNSTAFGLAPANTTLTIKYLVGGGVSSNVNSETITKVTSVILANDISDYNSSEITAYNAAVDSLVVLNPSPATGGGSGESADEIRENALAFFNAQSRIVTKEDYVVRAYALPAKYGTIAKVFALKDEQLSLITNLPPSTSDIPTTNTYVVNSVRPTAVNLYTLGYNSSEKLTTLNTATKENLAKYLDKYRMITDDINILDAFVINIGVQFDITVFRNYNIKDVLARSIDAVNEFFDINKWNINQPIIMADLYYQIGLVEGVQTVKDVRIFNKYQFQDGADYRPYRYNIAEATINGIVYPSLDPSIFELRYPQNDIIGNAQQ